MATLLAYPPVPEVGHDQPYYTHLCHRADRRHDTHGHEAAKVGQYVSLALSAALDWDHKLRYFKHALDHHCVPPQEFYDGDCCAFYRKLADLVREHCGREALRLALDADGQYAHRVEIGQLREKVVAEAEWQFRQLMGPDGDCPVWFDDEDWEQLQLIRHQWV